MHYIPEVKGVEQVSPSRVPRRVIHSTLSPILTTSSPLHLQVLDVEEEIALDEFSKLEQKLNRDKESERKRESSMGFSV